ncbi:MAG: 50S ribosomal protein L35 [Candidatus Babeliales bacterium]|jgi:large subunit ribosomal protein L35
MAKMKTCSSAKKRFKRVGKNKSKIKFSRAYRRHLLTKKTAKNKRQLRKGAYISKVDLPSIMRLLPY